MIIINQSMLWKETFVILVRKLLKATPQIVLIFFLLQCNRTAASISDSDPQIAFHAHQILSTFTPKVWISRKVTISYHRPHAYTLETVIVTKTIVSLERAGGGGQETFSEKIMVDIVSISIEQSEPINSRGGGCRVALGSGGSRDFWGFEMHSPTFRA